MKTVLITGAGSGFGKATALALAARGHKVIATTETQSQADALRAEAPQLEVVKLDITSTDDVAAASKFDVDVLINNAGALVQRVPIEEITDELFDNVVYLNVRSAMMCTAAAVAAMRQQGQGGVVINVTSVAARHGGGAGASLYAGSKGFVSTMTRGLAKELVKDNIRVNAVAPGVITTPFHERFSTPQMLEGFRATIPMNRLGTAEECAGAFVYLASEQMSGYVTGQIIEVNGGQYMP